MIEIASGRERVVFAGVEKFTGHKKIRILGAAGAKQKERANAACNAPRRKLTAVYLRGRLAGNGTVGGALSI